MNSKTPPFFQEEIAAPGSARNHKVPAQTKWFVFILHFNYKNRVMNITRTILIIAALTPFLHAEDMDFTKRSVTDPLLKITTSSTLLPEMYDKLLGGVRDEKHVPPVYRRLWSQQDVILLDPFSRERPAEIDFSAITKTNKGVLRIGARNDPRGDFVLELFKNGTSFKKETIGGNKWVKMTIPFDHEDVILKNIANGWSFEFAYIDYSFVKAQ